MPARVSLDGATGIWTIELAGAIDGAEVAEAIGRMHGSPDYRPSAPRLYDVREVQDTLGTPTLRSLAFKPDFLKTAEGARTAIVVTQDVTFGIARMYQTWMDDQPLTVRIFREVDEARAWLLEGEPG